MSDEPKRGRGRPPGVKNRPKSSVDGAVERGSIVERALPAPSGTTRAALEADRDRLLEGIEQCKGRKDPVSGATFTDWDMVAKLQSQLNGVQRMLLRITGETAPTDANLIRSPQYVRLKADLLTVLKKHPAALADVAAVFDTAET